MRPDRTGTPFLIVGENIHATRVLKRAGKHAVDARRTAASGSAFEAADGSRLVLPGPPGPPRRPRLRRRARSSTSRARSAGASTAATQAATAAAYIQALAARQERTGADWLDLNADEVSPGLGDAARGAMAWLVETVEATAGVPVSIDSSDVAVLAAGVAASTPARGPAAPQLGVDRATRGPRPRRRDRLRGRSSRRAAPAACRPTPRSACRTRSSSSRRPWPAGIPADHLYVDPLVLPVAVEPEAPVHVLEAARQLRAEYGDVDPPDRRPVQRLVRDAGAAPAQRHVHRPRGRGRASTAGSSTRWRRTSPRVFGADRDSEPYRLAADMLLGRDPFGGEYVLAFREGRLGAGEG